MASHTVATTNDLTGVVHGTCHHDCPDSCGWTATVSDGVAVKLRGNPDHPYSAGELCPKVNRFLDRVYSPDRVLTPLRRAGAKGSGEFDPISWDEALAEIAERLHHTIENHGAEAVLPFSSAGNQSLLATMGLSSRFFHHMGASQIVRGICGPTVGAGLAVTNGTALAADALDLEHSQLIILWGTNTRLTNRHLWPTIERARSNGARLVVIDPIRTITAEVADHHIAPRPGTDVAMMLAMMHVIIRDDLIDREWVQQHTLGFDDLRSQVADWTPDRAAAETGVSAETIEQLAHDYATVRPAAIRTLIGAEHHTNGAMFFRTLGCLPALVGSWRERGGGLMRSVGTWQEQLIDVGAMTRPDLLGSRTPRSINMGRLGDALLDKNAPIHALMVWNANPVVTIPNAAAIRAGLARHDLFCVVHEQFITDTARYADIVLPATTQLEANDVVIAWGHLWMGWNEAAIAPVGESVSNTELFRRLAAAMSYDEPSLFDDDDTLIRQALPDVDIDALRRNGWWRVPYPDTPTPFSDGGFPTTSGKVEFVSASLAAADQPPLPTYVPPAQHGGHPLVLLTTKHHQRFLNSSYSHLPKHGPAEGAPFVELHPSDAEARGIADGDAVAVFNHQARLTVTAKVSDRLGAGTAMMPWGWWSDQHGDGGVANDLTSDASTDWGPGTAFFDTRVDVEPTATAR